jgi:hypothetical protein
VICCLFFFPGNEERLLLLLILIVVYIVVYIVVAKIERTPKRGGGRGEIIIPLLPRLLSGQHRSSSFDQLFYIKSEKKAFKFDKILPKIETLLLL